MNAMRTGALKIDIALPPFMEKKCSRKNPAFFSDNLQKLFYSKMLSCPLSLTFVTDT